MHNTATRLHNRWSRALFIWLKDMIPIRIIFSVYEIFLSFLCFYVPCPWIVEIQCSCRKRNHGCKILDVVLAFAGACSKAARDKAEVVCLSREIILAITLSWRYCCCNHKAVWVASSQWKKTAERGASFQAARWQTTEGGSAMQGEFSKYLEVTTPVCYICRLTSPGVETGLNSFRF